MKSPASTISIIKKWPLVVLVGGMSMLLILGAFFFYSNEEKSIRENKHNEITAIAGMKIGQITQWRKERMGDARITAQATFFIEGINLWLNNTNNSALKNEILQRLVRVKNGYEYQDIYLSSSRGELLISTDPQKSKLEPFTSAKIIEAVNSRQLVFTDFYFCPADKMIHYDLIAPVMNNKNIVIAAVILRVDPQAYLYPLIQSWPAPSKTSETLLIRKEGDSVRYLNELRLQKNTALNLCIPLSRKDVPAVQAVLGFKGIFDGNDYRGVPVLADIEPVPGTPWFMIAKVDKSEIYAELQFRAVLISLFTFSLILLIGIGLTLVYNSRQKNIYRELLAKEKELWANQEEYKTTLYSIGDAVITADVHGAVRHMNPVAEQLTGWHEAEANGMPMDEVFKIVNEDTRIMVDSPVDRVLREGMIVGLANHTVLISKDGKETPITDSGAPIKNRAGEITGVVLVFRDQSIERTTRKLVSESESRYRGLFENMLNGFAYCKMIFEDGSPKDFMYLNVNNAFETLTGLKNVEGKKVSEVIPGIQASDPQLFELYGRVALTGKPETFETYVNALKMWFSISVYSSQKEYFIAVFDVITEGKHADETLRNSERKYRTLHESMIDGFVSVRMDGTFLECNEVYRKMLGYTEAELSRLTYVEITPERWHEYERDVVNNQILKRGYSDIYEKEYRRKDGSIFPVELHTVLLRDEEGNPAFMWAIVRDITERKHAEEALRESENKFRTIAEQMHEMIYLTDDRGTINYVSPAASSIFGFTPGEMEGHPFTDFLVESDIPRAIAAFARDISTGHPTDHLELTMKRKNGSFLIGELNGTRYQRENIIGTIGLIRDVTDYKKAEQALQENEALLNEVGQIAKIGGWAMDLVTRKARWTRGTYDIGEIEPGEPIPGPDEHVSFYLPEYQPLIDEAMRALIEEDKPLEFEAQMRTAKGNLKWCHAIGKAVRKGDTCVMVHGTFQDITERKRAEEAMQEKERYQRALLDNFPFAVWLKDTESRFLAVNQIFAETFHIRTPDELAGKSDFDIIERSIAEEYIAHDRFVMQSRQKSIMEQKLSGFENDRWYESYKAPVIGKNDELLGTVGFLRDITERKQTEAALQESEERFRSLYENSTIGLYRTTPGGKIILANPTLFKMLGYSTFEELAARNLEHDGFEPSYERKKFIEQIELHGEVIGLESAWNRQDGSIVYLRESARIIRGPDGTTLYYDGSVEDISERKRAEVELSRSEEKYRSIFENVQDVYYETLFDGTIIEVSPSIEIISKGQYKRADLIGKSMYEFYPDAGDRDTILAAMQKSKSVNDFEVQLKNRDGSFIPCSVSAKMIFNAEGRPVKITGSMHDISERKQAEDTLRQMQKLEGIGTLAGGIAHDFNNILGIILAFNSNIIKFKDDEKKLDTASKTIAKAVERGRTLVQQILTFARKTETLVGPVNVNDVVAEIMTMILETFPKILTFAQNFEKGIPFINADRSQLHQALLNLCVNARDAMPGGGTLTINTRIVSSMALRGQHPDAAASSYVCVEVSDTGEGMTPETRKHIFEPFFTTKEKGKGTGLGLAVVFGVVQTHKGFIDVNSEPGKGTAFRLYLPVSQVTELASVKEEETLEDIPGGAETVLVVEDEEMLMMSLQMVLADKGYTVLSAGDGLAALNIYQERKNDIDLVLTDLGLPTMTGMEECLQIKKLNPGARIIVATGFLDPKIKMEFLKAGVQHFLYKPYDLVQVLKAVRELLNQKG